MENLSCNPNLNITRDNQQDITNDFLKVWLDFSLKSNQNSFNIFNDSLQVYNRITYSQLCNVTGISNHNVNEIKIFPNPVIDILKINIPSDYINGELTIQNIFGQQLYNKLVPTTNTKNELSNYKSGSYFISYKKDAFVKKIK